MASEEQKGGCFTLTWEIKNFGLLLAGNYKTLSSPILEVEHTEGTAWSRISTFHSGTKVFFSVSEDHLIKLLNRCEMSVISSSGDEVPLEVSIHLDLGTLEIDDRFCEKRQSILPNDTLTFTWRMTGEKIFTREFSICSVLHSLNHLWNIEDYRSTYSAYIKKDNFLLHVDLDQESGFGTDNTHTFKVEVVPWVESCLTFVDCALFIKDGLGTVVDDTTKESSLKWKCDVEISSESSSINFKLQMTLAVHKFCQDPGSSGALGDDLLRLYRENPLSEATATLNTEDKSFSAHRSILAARSPVFRAMFEKGEMSEGRLGVVNIDDMDSDTVDLMLVYLYSDSLDGVQWEEAAKLYYAADKYAILSLKQKCANILKTGLTVDNFCDALVLADTHTDEQFMRDIVHFIIHENDEVIFTEKLGNFQINNPDLASKISRELCVKKRKK